MVWAWLFGSNTTSTSSKETAEKAKKQQQQQQQELEKKKKAEASKKQQQQQQDEAEEEEHYEEENQEEGWIYDMLLQYLTSPLWKIPIYEFLDEHCIVFDDEEENKFEYTDVHNKFKKTIEKMIDQLMLDIGINEDQFFRMCKLGLSRKNHRKIFEQILIIDDFRVFKKLMIKRNKELELEALKEMDKDVPANGGKGLSDQQQNELKLKNLEKEKAEIDLAIQMSLSAKDEESKMLEMEEQMLRQALEESTKSFELEQSKLNQQLSDSKVAEENAKLQKEAEDKKKKEELLKKQKELKEKAAREKEEKAKLAAEQLKAEEEEKKVKLAEEEKAKQQQEQAKQQQVVAEQPVKKEISSLEGAPKISPQKPQQQLQPVEDITAKPAVIPKKEVIPVQEELKSDEVSNNKQQSLARGLSKQSTLPPLVSSKFDKTIEDLKSEQQNIDNEIHNYKSALDKIKNAQVEEIPKDEKKEEESLEERKQRLLKQRELLRKQKQKQREDELKKFQELNDATDKDKQKIKKELDQGSLHQSLAIKEEPEFKTVEVSQEEKEKRQRLLNKIKNSGVQ